MKEQTASKVPQIRFKGFGEEWEEKTLGALGRVAMNKRVFKHQTSETGDVPFYKIGTFGKEPDSFISRKLFDEYKSKFPYPLEGDLLISASGSIGRIVEYSGKDEYFQDSNIVWLQHNGAVVNAFLKQYYSFVEWAGLEGSTIKRLYNKNILETRIVLPNKEEQTQIGEYFRELDSLIGLHQRKHDKLVTLKNAMLQKMFPQPGASIPEVRFKGFSGEWVKKKLGECVLIQRGGSPRPIENFITQDANGINWVKIGDVKIGSRYITQTEEKIKPEGVSKSREVFKGDLILSNSMSFGRPYLMAIDGCIHDGWLLIRNDKNLFDLDYLLQLLSSETMTEQYRSLAAGGVVNNLNSALVQSTNISFPDKPEQQKIGTYFRTLDELISQHATQLQKLQQIKSACLEKMFV
ncbi:restriction endonuclease subunit S [Methylomonas sp. OY6]|uniref:Restriction endonuclease subunit S n=1 Tax=Methylomonas defluvii TaxID=3045149 RepID=A0ABU4UNI5_9GAMM|nr:restriction endonuclease subunit S [Methylomonas sp. OY6]MDX8130407.1 restriction endonuclease subunit S [Methylomonas sp. OY6]